MDKKEQIEQISPEEEWLMRHLLAANENTMFFYEYYNPQIRDLPPEILKTYESFSSNIYFRFGQLTAEIMVALFPSPDTSQDKYPYTPGNLAIEAKRLCIQGAARAQESDALQEFLDCDCDVETASTYFDLGLGAGLAHKSIRTLHFIKNTKK